MKSLGIGFPTEGNKNNIVVPEAQISPNMIGNISKPDFIICKPACTVQNNNNQMSFAPYPQQGNFFYQKTFCEVASHIWHETCQDENRAFFMNRDWPLLCPLLKNFDELLGNFSVDICQKWPENYFEKYDKPNITLMKEMYQYGRQNLALIHVMIQSPYVTKIKRDVAITLVSYVADTGGLLGLCLGFSFISIIEIIFWFCSCCREFKRF